MRESEPMSGELPSLWLGSRLRWATWLVIAIVANGGVAMADQNDSALDGLFARLAAARDVAEAAVIEEEIWTRWLESGRDDVDEQMTRGMRAMERGDGATALLAFDAVVELAPDFAEGWNKRATLHWLTGDWRSSVADIDRTLALEARHFGALSGLALILEAEGKPFEALEALEQVIAIHPRLPQLPQRIEKLTRQLGEAV